MGLIRIFHVPVFPILFRQNKKYSGEKQEIFKISQILLSSLSLGIDSSPSLPNVSLAIFKPDLNHK